VDGAETRIVTPLEEGAATRVLTASASEAARLRKLRERVLSEKQAVCQMRVVLEQLEAHATRARREELQLRHLVVHLAEWIATAAMAPAVAATALAAAGGLAASAAAMSAAVATKALSPPPAALDTAHTTTSCTEEAILESQLLRGAAYAPIDSLAVNQLISATG